MQKENNQAKDRKPLLSNIINDNSNSISNFGHLPKVLLFKSFCVRILFSSPPQRTFYSFYDVFGYVLSSTREEYSTAYSFRQNCNADDVGIWSFFFVANGYQSWNLSKNGIQIKSFSHDVAAQYNGELGTDFFPVAYLRTLTNNTENPVEFLMRACISSITLAHRSV